MQDSENGRRNAFNLAAFTFAGIIAMRPSGLVDNQDRRNESLAYMLYNSIPREPVNIVGIGKTMMFPGGSYNNRREYVEPLQATDGSKALAAATAEQVINEPINSDEFGYLTSVSVICTGTSGATACSISVLDGPGGKVVWRVNLLAKPGTVGIEYKRHFQIPPRTAVAGGNFVATTTGADVTWDININGYRSSIMGNRANLSS